MSAPLRRWVGEPGQEVLVTYEETGREPGPRCDCSGEYRREWGMPFHPMPEYHAEGCPWGEFWLERK